MGHKNQPRGNYIAEIEAASSAVARFALSVKFARMALDTLPPPEQWQGDDNAVRERDDALFDRVQNGVIMGSRNDDTSGTNKEVPAPVLSNDAQLALADIRVLIYPEHRNYAAAHETLSALVSRGEWCVGQLLATKRWWQFWK